MNSTPSLISRSTSVSRPRPKGAFRFCHERRARTGFSLRWSSSYGSAIESNDVAGVSVKNEVLGVVKVEKGFVAVEDVTDEKLSVDQDFCSDSKACWFSRLALLNSSSPMYLNPLTGCTGPMPVNRRSEASRDILRGMSGFDGAGRLLFLPCGITVQEEPLLPAP